MSRSRITFEDLPASIGSVIVGAPFAVAAEDQERFEKATWLDRAYPRDAPEFPGTLVEGFLLLSMLDAVLQLADPTDSTSMWGLNYGLDRVRFIAPVHLGDRIVPSFEITAVEPKDLGYKVLRRCTFTLEGTGATAMTADWWTFVLPAGTLERARREGIDP